MNTSACTPHLHVVQVTFFFRKRGCTNEQVSQIEACINTDDNAPADMHKADKHKQHTGGVIAMRPHTRAVTSLVGEVDLQPVRVEDEAHTFRRLEKDVHSTITDKHGWRGS